MTPRTRRILLVAGVAVGCGLVLAACAAGANPQAGTAPPGSTQPAGFWLGLWQGLILPITFVISLFRDSVSIYEVHNSGNWYDFGFVLGAACSLGGGIFGGSRRRH
ncbi:MAG: hypothetical protein FWF90_07625 [Promicromonosporaceae bacterium]|nr:hypothetical protein [Promicromonosporaceae bacterium]